MKYKTRDSATADYQFIAVMIVLTLSTYSVCPKKVMQEHLKQRPGGQKKGPRHNLTAHTPYLKQTRL